MYGTPWAIDARGAILFIEDVSEALDRVDRLLTQLRQTTLLGAATSFLLGSFSEDADPTAALREHLASLGKPVLAGWPAGHGRPNRVLPPGARVTLDAAAARSRWRQRQRTSKFFARLHPLSAQGGSAWPGHVDRPQLIGSSRLE